VNVGSLGGIRRRLANTAPPAGPARYLIAAVFTETFGRGVYLTVSALYFTRIVGIRPDLVGVGLTIAGLVGLTVGVPLGYFADRFGPRRILIAMLIIQGLAAATYSMAQNFWMYMASAVAVVVGERGAYAARGAIMAVVVAGPNRTRTRAYLRSVSNVGIAVGTSVASIAVTLDRSTVYIIALLLNAACYCVSAGLSLKLPTVPGARHEPVSRFGVIGDVKYLVVAALSGILCIHYAIMEVGIPLWVAGHTIAPRWMISALLLINTIAVILFQVKIGGAVGSVGSASRGFRRAGVLFLVTCALMAFASTVSMYAAIIVLLVGGIVYVGGEMLQAASAWTFSYDLADEKRQGQYQALFGTASSGGMMLGPSIVTTLVIGGGKVGWLLFGLLLFSLSVVLGPVGTWVLRARSQGKPSVDTLAPLADG
jgi:MFS family permease